MTSLKQTLRSLANRPGFAIVSIVTLAFGVGTTTAMFSLLDTIVIKPLPYPDPGQLVAVYEASPSRRESTSLIAPARLADWKRMSSAFTALSGAYSESETDTSGSEPERLDGRRVMPDYFAVYGMAPLAGRTFTPDEERFGGPTAAVISEGLWTRRYGRQAATLGQRLMIGGKGYTIVGVMPAAFAPGTIDVWLPAQITPFLQTMRTARFLNGVGRLKPGSTIAQAADDLDRVQRSLGDQFPDTDKDWSASVRDLKTLRVGEYRSALWLVFGAVACLLLIVIANVGGLMLVQLHRRARELAIRTAVGASRAQVVGAVLREVLAVSGIAAIAGALGARWALGLLRTEFATLPRITELALDWRALAFAAAATLVAALLFGLVPALQATRGDLAAGVTLGARGVAGSRHRLQKSLVVAQMALAIPLAGSAGLLLRSYANLTAVDTGFDPRGTVTFHVGAGWSEDRAKIGQLQVQLIDALQRLPGVQAAGFTNFLPATGATLRYQIAVAGLAGPDAGGMFTVGERTVTPGYLKALNVPLVAGTWCHEPNTDLNAPSEAMVNRQFVERYAHGQSLAGRTFHFAQETVAHRIAGVVGDVAEDGPGAPLTPYVYACLPPGSWPDPNYVVRTADPRTILPSIRQVVHGLAPSRAIFGVQTLDDVLAASLDQPRMDSSVLGLFAGTALALAALGLYSLFMLLVSERTRELGVRMALGANATEVVRLVCAGAARLLAAGTVAGLAIAVALARLLRVLLYGVSPLDAATLAAAVLTLGVAALAAIALPVWRAARVDPLQAMRE